MVKAGQFSRYSPLTPHIAEVLFWTLNGPPMHGHQNSGEFMFRDTASPSRRILTLIIPVFH